MPNDKLDPNDPEYLEKFYDNLKLVSTGAKFPNFLASISSPKSPIGNREITGVPGGMMVMFDLIHPESEIPDGDVMGRVEMFGKTYLISWHDDSLVFQSEQTGVMLRFSAIDILAAILANSGSNLPDIDDPSVLDKPEELED